MNSLILNGTKYQADELKFLCQNKSQESSEKKNILEEQQFFEFLEEWLAGRPYINAHTSGSTGKPKAIRLARKSMVKSAQMTAQHFDLGPHTKALLCLPTRYIAGKMMIVRSFVNQWNLIRVPVRANPLAELEHPVDFAAMIPMQVETCLKENPNRFIQIPKVIIGGAPISPQLLAQIQKLPNACYATYGMTETITHIAVKRLNGPNPQHTFQALPGVSFRQDLRGCLVIDAPHIHEEISTNDVIDLQSKTSFQWLGRADNVINSGGVKIHPEQVEEKIGTLFQGTRFYISAEADARLSNKVVLYIEDEPWNNPRLQSLKEALRKLLSRYEVPREIYFIHSFEETETGKVIRR